MKRKIKNCKIVKFIESKQVFIKYVIVSGSSFIIDLGIFTILSKLLVCFFEGATILFATIIARVISSLFNYMANRNAVFKNKDSKLIDMVSFFKYYGLVVIQMFISALMVTVIFNITKLNETLVKIPVDIVIFIINYIIQKNFIFNKKM